MKLDLVEQEEGRQSLEGDDDERQKYRLICLLVESLLVELLLELGLLISGENSLR